MKFHFLIVFSLFFTFLSCKTSNSSSQSLNSHKIEFNQGGNTSFLLISPDDTHPNYTNFSIELVSDNAQKNLYKSSSSTQYTLVTNSIVTTDEDKNGTEEVYFYFVDNNKADPKFHQFIYANQELHSVLWNYNAKNKEGNVSKFFTRSMDKSVKALPTKIQNKIDKIYYTGIETANQYDVFDTQKIENKAMSDNYNKFKSSFPTLSNSFSVKDNELESIKAERLFSKFTHDFICFVPNSNLDCIIKSEMSKTTPDLDLRTNFLPYGKLERDKYDVLFYKIDFEETQILYLATYSKSGDFLSRLVFAGINSDQELRNGEFTNSAIKVTTIEFKYGKKGQQDAITNTKTLNYAINDEGSIFLNGELIKDDI